MSRTCLMRILGVFALTQSDSGRPIQTCSKRAEHLQENDDFIYCDSRFTMETKYAKIMNGIKGQITKNEVNF